MEKDTIGRVGNRDCSNSFVVVRHHSLTNQQKWDIRTGVKGVLADHDAWQEEKAVERQLMKVLWGGLLLDVTSPLPITFLHLKNET